MKNRSRQHAAATTSSPTPASSSSLLSAQVDFDSWIKLATDNKINQRNSWNVDLIDYFQNLSYLRSHDGINFNKASATLDGCIKIYSSRIDSVALETGKLLSGLTSSTPTADDDTTEPRVEERRLRTNNQRVETTLVKSFDQLKARESPTELSFDPVFKKTLSDFDEGGAKSLLLNTLSINSAGRIGFDSFATATPTDAKSEFSDQSPGVVRFDRLRQFIYSETDTSFDSTHVSPSLYVLQEIIENGGDQNLLHQIGDRAHDGVDFNWDTCDDSPDDILDESILEIHDTPPQPTPRSGIPDYELLAYFDDTLKHTDRIGHREHWKIANLKRQRINPEPPITVDKTTRKRPSHLIDFFQPELDADDLFRQDKHPPTRKRLELSSTPGYVKALSPSANHQLPIDYQFSARRLIHLFSKPWVTLRTFNKRAVSPHPCDSSVPQTHDASHQHDDQIVDEYFVASHHATEDEKYDQSRRMDDIAREELNELHQSYDQSFFEDTINDDDEESFDDMANKGNLTLQGYGSQLITESANHIIPTYINFNRTSTKVDVRLLKELLWQALEPPLRNGPVVFRCLVNEVVRRYPGEQREALSTSFCFICVLHLANEHSLTIEDQNGETVITKFPNGFSTL